MGRIPFYIRRLLLDRVGNMTITSLAIYVGTIDTLQIQFGACQKLKSYTIEVLLTFYYYNKTL